MKRDIAASVLATMTASAVRRNHAAGLVCQVRRIDRPVPWDRYRWERAIASRERCGSLRMFLANEFARAEIEPDDRRGSDKRKQPPSLGLFEPEMRRSCAAMIDRQIARQMPIHASLVLKKLSKTRSRFADAMPSPSSEKEKTPSRSSSDGSMSIRALAS
jgi:hypothetical protein